MLNGVGFDHNPRVLLNFCDSQRVLDYTCIVSGRFLVPNAIIFVLFVVSKRCKHAGVGGFVHSPNDSCHCASTRCLTEGVCFARYERTSVSCMNPGRREEKRYRWPCRLVVRS